MSGIARIRPSRRFLIAQACLNVALRENPRLGTVCGLTWLTNNGHYLPGWLHVAITREFRALSERWAA